MNVFDCFVQIGLQTAQAQFVAPAQRQDCIYSLCYLLLQYIVYYCCMFCIVLYCFLLYCVSVTVYCYYLYCVLLYCVIVTGLRSGVWTVKKLTSCDMRPLGLRIVRPPPRPGGAGGSSAGSEPVCDIHFTFWISLSLRPKTETKRLNFDFRPVLRSTNHRSASSLTSSATHR